MQTDATTVTRRRRRYGDRVPPRVLRAHVVLGSMQVAVGGLAILANTVGFVVGQFYSKGMGAYIFGPIFVLAGILGILAGKRVGRTMALVVSCLVFSIISSFLAFIAIYTEAVTMKRNSVLYEGPPPNGTDPYSAFRDPYFKRVPGAYQSVMFSSVACGILFALELVLAIVHAAFGCRASCCCVPKASAAEELELAEPMQPRAEKPAAEPVQVAFYPGQQLAFYPGQQVAFYMGQPLAFYPGQQAASYPGQQAAGYPVQQGAGYSGQQAAGYPVQQGAGYSGQQGAGYPGQQAVCYPGQQADQNFAPPPSYDSVSKD